MFISHFVGGQRPTKEDGNAACDIDLASRQRQIAAIVSLGYLVEGIERVIAPPPGLGDVWVDAAIPTEKRSDPNSLPNGCTSASDISGSGVGRSHDPCAGCI